MMKKNIPMFLAGLFCGAALFGGSVAYAAGILATPTTDIDQRITLDGQEIELIGYVINGNNYFQLRDLGDKLGFGVSWDNDPAPWLLQQNLPGRARIRLTWLPPPTPIMRQRQPAPGISPKWEIRSFVMTVRPIPSRT